MRTALAVLAGRFVRVLARLRGGGSAMPGRVALLIDPKLLTRAVAALPLGVAFVSGSNGKSTTTQMLVKVLRAHGVKVFTNPSGANLPQGVASAMLGELPLDGRLRSELAVLEVDEAFGPRLATMLDPHSVLLINLQVDQLNRFYEPDRVLAMLEKFSAGATQASRGERRRRQPGGPGRAPRSGHRGRRVVRDGSRTAGGVAVAREGRQSRTGGRHIRSDRRRSSPRR